MGPSAATERNRGTAGAICSEKECGIHGNTWEAGELSRSPYPPRVLCISDTFWNAESHIGPLVPSLRMWVMENVNPALEYSADRFRVHIPVPSKLGNLEVPFLRKFLYIHLSS